MAWWASGRIPWSMKRAEDEARKFMDTSTSMEGCYCCFPSLHASILFSNPLQYCIFLGLAISCLNLFVCFQTNAVDWDHRSLMVGLITSKYLWFVVALSWLWSVCMSDSVWLMNSVCMLYKSQIVANVIWFQTHVMAHDCLGYVFDVGYHRICVCLCSPSFIVFTNAHT